MPKDPALPERVFSKGRWHYLVVADGKRRRWHKLSMIRDGLPALYTALAAWHTADQAGRPRMPQLAAMWQADVASRHSTTWQANEAARGRHIAERFADFHPDEVTTPDCVEFLAEFRDRPRTHNAYRAQLGELMRYAMEKGLRPAGTNPVIGVIRTMACPPRERCPTTSEIRRVKIGCLYGDDGKRTRSGMTMACLIELAYLTGQDVGVMIRLREQRDPHQPDEPHCTEYGLWFRRDKTGGTVEIAWSDRLRAVIARLKALKAERALKRRAAQRVDTPLLFVKQDGTPLTYSAVTNAWQDGVRRSGVLHFMFRDIRARAITDVEERHGMRAANALGTHTTEAQTADYIRRKKARRTQSAA